MGAMEITLMQPAGLVASPAFSRVAIVPAGAATIYLGAAYGAIARQLARAGAPPLVTAARVAGLAVPGALIEVSAIAAVMPT
jgi:enamine deaminase RidA (YjgF/YER057c/UK114 family)